MKGDTKRNQRLVPRRGTAVLPTVADCMLESYPMFG